MSVERSAQTTVLLPDAGPLDTLAYANALDLLIQPHWTLRMVDMVLHEVTRSTTPTSEALLHAQHPQAADNA